MARLRQLHQQRRLVLLLGAEGMGKSALVEQLREPLALHVCPASEHLSEICGALEHALGIEAGDFDLVKRKNRLLKLLKEAKHAVVVFDSLRVPVWLCVRSGKLVSINSRLLSALSRTIQKNLTNIGRS